jgi:hypothetical protein
MNETQNPALNNSIDQMSGADEQLWMAAGRPELSFRCDTSAPDVEHGPGRAEESVSLWPPIERIEAGPAMYYYRRGELLNGGLRASFRSISLGCHGLLIEPDVNM